VVVTAAGWQVRVPSDWGKSSLSTDPDADSACLGPAKGDPCLVRLVAGRNPGNLPNARKLGGGLVQDYARLDCRAGDASETTIEGATGSAGVIGLRCGSRRYEQVWLWSRNLLAVGRTDGADGADLVGKVLAGLAVDRSYPAMRTLDCPDVALAARSDKTVTGLAATGASCAEATALVRAVDPRLSVITGPSKIAVKGYTCSVTLDTVSVLPAADLTCRRDDGGATVTYRQG
jgi:3D (Asp-Asp-Asp) domain-containing protein